MRLDGTVKSGNGARAADSGGSWRIVDDPSGLSEISGEHLSESGCIPRPKTRSARAGPRRTRETRSIPPHRPTDCAAELVSLQVLPYGSEEAPGIEKLVAEELEDFPVELVAPAPGDDVDDGGTGPLLRHQETRLHLELIDGGNGRAQRQLSIPRAFDVEAIE